MKSASWSGTRNKTEHILGTFSLASRLSSHLPLVGLWKSEILKLCKHVGVPEEIIASSKKADPACGRPQELVQIPLDLVDLFLQVKLGESRKDLDALTAPQREYLEDLYARGGFKRHLPLLSKG